MVSHIRASPTSPAPRPPIRHYEHSAQLVRNVYDHERGSKKVIVIGLSHGGAIAVGFALPIQVSYVDLPLLQVACPASLLESFRRKMNSLLGRDPLPALTIQTASQD